MTNRPMSRPVELTASTDMIAIKLIIRVNAGESSIDCMTPCPFSSSQSMIRAAGSKTSCLQTTINTGARSNTARAAVSEKSYLTSRVKIWHIRMVFSDGNIGYIQAASHVMSRKQPDRRNMLLIRTSSPCPADDINAFSKVKSLNVAPAPV